MNKASQRQSEHDRKVIDNVIQILSKGYDTVLTHVPYWVEDSNDTHGELDILAIRGNNVHYYEVKGRDSATALRKAVYQTNEFGRNLDRVTNLEGILPKEPNYRKIYISYRTDGSKIVKRLH